jgi:hypothetical protein
MLWTKTVAHHTAVRRVILLQYGNSSFSIKAIVMPQTLRVALLMLFCSLLSLATSVRARADEKPARKLAFLVGVTDYNHAKLAQLRFSENDVVEFGKVLSKQGYEVTLLTTTGGRKKGVDAPSADNIRSQLARVLKDVSVRDMIVVGLAGHGLQILDQNESYFCPEDANPAITGEGETARFSRPETLLGMHELIKSLDDSGIGQKLVLIDACRNDPSVRGRRGVVDVSIATAAQCGILLSCSPGEFSFEDAKLGTGHGAFFYHVIQGISGEARNRDDVVTWNSLSDYVREKVPRKVKELYGDEGGRQNPNQFGDLRGVPPVLARVEGSKEMSNPERPQSVSPPRSGARAYLGAIPEFESDEPGCLISGATLGSPADRIGLKKGDRIVKLGNHPITNVDDFASALKSFKGGDEADVIVVRDLRELRLKVKFESHKSEKAPSLSVAGGWSGVWRNSFDESGSETVELRQDKESRLEGVFSGNIPIKGEQIGEDAFYFEGSNERRFYRCAGRIEAGKMRLDYCAHRTTPDGGHYFGWANLLQNGSVTATPDIPFTKFAGQWKSMNESNVSSSLGETLLLKEEEIDLEGEWRGVAVKGERLGNGTLYLNGRQGERTFQLVGYVVKGALVLNYSIREGKNQHHGQATLTR